MVFGKQNILLLGVVCILVLLVAIGVWGFSWSLFGAEFHLSENWALEMLLICYPNGSNNLGWSAEVGGPFLFFLSLVMLWLIKHSPTKLLHVLGATLVIVGSFAPWKAFEWIGRFNGFEIHLGQNGSVQFSNNGGLITLLWGSFITMLIFVTPNFVKRPKRLIAFNLGVFATVAIFIILNWQLRLVISSLLPTANFGFGVTMVLLGLLLMGCAELRDSRERRTQHEAYR